MDPTEERLRAAYIEGDETVLLILADWYEDQDDPLAGEIRRWCRLQGLMADSLEESIHIIRDGATVVVSDPPPGSRPFPHWMVDLIALRWIPVPWGNGKPLVYLMRDQLLYGKILRQAELWHLDLQVGLNREIAAWDTRLMMLEAEDRQVGVSIAATQSYMVLQEGRSNAAKHLTVLLNELPCVGILRHPMSLAATSLFLICWPASSGVAYGSASGGRAALQLRNWQGLVERRIQTCWAVSTEAAHGTPQEG